MQSYNDCVQSINTNGLYVLAN